LRKSPKAVTTRQIQLLDKIAIEAIGIPSLVLMENAGRAVSQEIMKRLVKPTRAFVSIWCGLGNNAGDGFVTARHLLDAGVKTKVFLIGDAKNLKSDASLNYHILRKLGCPVYEIKRMDERLRRTIAASDIVVDAIFGVGLNRNISEPFKSLIKTLNAQRKFIVSIDIPSGLDGTTGRIYGVCVRASVTVTLSCPKRGFFIHEGPRHIGRLVVADIGIPKKLFNSI
jgi:NAD(P)H-hydrate epimerase